MDNNRETDQIVLAVQKAAFLMDPGFKLAMVGAALLVTYLARMVKEGKLNKGEFKNVQEFLKATDGKYTIFNVPFEKNYNPWKAEARTINGKDVYIVKNMTTGDILQGKDGKEQTWTRKNKAGKEADLLNRKENLVLDELKQQDIRHVIMPDLNQDDGMVQIAVYDNDKDKFTNFLGKYLSSRMRGGEHGLQELKNLTESRVSIVSIPFEGKTDAIFEDFRKLEINYAILPDLSVGDGEIQLMVANSDMAQLQQWFTLYQSDMLKDGIEVPDMKHMDMDGYMRTAEMTEEQYVDTASEDLKKANEKYEGKEPGTIEKRVMRQENKVRSESDAAYLKYDADPDYIKISIDKETCVKESHFPGSEILAEKGIFCSRVPGTWMNGTNNCNPEQTLLVPVEQVFMVNDGQTYCAFIKKDGQMDLRELNGEPTELKLTGRELYAKHYDPVNWNHSNTKQMHKQPAKSQEKQQPYQKKQQAKDLNNFEHRKYNMDDLEAQLLNADRVKAPTPPVKAR